MVAPIRVAWNPTQPKRFVQSGNPRGLGSPSRPGGFGNPNEPSTRCEPGTRCELGAPRGPGTSAASAITRKHRKYQHEIHQTIFDHLSDLSCWRDLEIHITAADSSQHLWNGHLVRRSYERTDQAGCSSRNWKISYRNHATHVHTGGSRADGQLGKSASDFTARCDHHDRDQHHCHGIHRTAVSMGHPTWKKAGGGKDETKERGVS